VSPATGSGNGTIIVNVPANPIVAQRAATVTLSAGTLTRTVSVTQAEGDVILSVDKTTINATSTTGSYTIAVTSNTSWSASRNTMWYSLSNASATGNGTVTVGVTENPTVALRAATITFNAGTFTRTVTVTQAPNTPLYAASTQTWVMGDQIWSDAIQIPECNKASFYESNDTPQCRSYTEGKTWYYYNWAYVDQYAATLCPSPWRVPTKSDFESLKTNPTVSLLFNDWGTGGEVVASGPSFVLIFAGYWSSVSKSDISAYLLRVDPTIYQEVNYWGSAKYMALQVRCVH
jgi:hypothetical protein